MTSKISYFKIALDDLRHRMWMIALSCTGSLLALPIFFLFANDSYIASYHRVLEYDSLQFAQSNLDRNYAGFLMYYSRISCSIILFIGALIVGIFGYRYLYSRKMIDLYHSMPVKRNALFLIHYIDGFLIWLIPMLISLGITLILLLVNMARYNIINNFGSYLLVIGQNLLLYILAFLTVYNFCLFCVMLCGNAFNAICLTGLGGVLVAGLWGLHCAYSSVYLHTYHMPTLDFRQVSWASPLVNAVVLLLEENDRSGLFQGEPFFLFMSILVIIATFAAALLLYLRRPSELAEHGIDNRPTQHIIRIAVSIAAGLSLGGIFIVVLNRTAYGWILFGIVFGVFLIFGILNVIFHMDFRAFLKYKLELFLTVLAACLLLPIYRFDLTGFDTRLPRQANIEGVKFEFGGLGDSLPNYRTQYLGSNSTDTRQDDFVHYEDTTPLYHFLQTLTDKAHISAAAYSYGGSCIVYLQQKNGSVFARSYRVLDTDQEQLRSIIEDDRFRDIYYPVSSGLYGAPDQLQINCSFAGLSYRDLNATQRTDIMDAYTRDFLNHYTMEELTSGVTVCELRAEYHKEDDTPTYSYEYFPVYDTYTETMATILKYYPDCPIVRDNLNIASIDITLELSGDLPLDTLYSYFGLDGYPSYTEASEDYYYFHLRVDDPGDMNELYPYLHIGSLYSNSLSHLCEDRYVYLGDLVLESGDHVSCYVDRGQFPKEWIERIEITPDADYDADYYDYNRYEYDY
ncbi:MAG: hypothetical protein IJ833_05900 [Lachnospiraceae bacterium]|nr:hypothetical protein [Lachnospiraceae bacterium]